MSSQPHRNLNKAIRCPKCRSKELKLKEHTPGKITMYRQDAQQQIHREEEITDSTATTYVTAHCECGQTWRVRGVQALDQLTYVQEQANACTSAP